MSMSKSRTWTLATALVVLAVFALGWFTLISPKRSEAAELRASAESAVAQNIITEAKIRQLKLQQKDLPQQQAQIAAINQQLPATPQLPSLIRQLLAADQSGAVLTAISPSTITPMPGNPGVSYIPVTVGVRGNFTELKRYLFALEENKRAVLVTGFQIGKAEANGDSLDVIQPDDLNMTIEIRVFIAGTAASTTVVTPAPSGAGATTPTPGATPTAGGAAAPTAAAGAAAPTPTAPATAPAAAGN